MPKQTQLRSEYDHHLLPVVWSATKGKDQPLSLISQGYENEVTNPTYLQLPLSGVSSKDRPSCSHSIYVAEEQYVSENWSEFYFRNIEKEAEHFTKEIKH